MQDFAFAILKFSLGWHPRISVAGGDDPLLHSPPARPSAMRGGCAPVAVTHTRPRACTSLPPKFLGPSTAPGHRQYFLIISYVFVDSFGGLRMSLNCLNVIHAIIISC